MGDDDGPDRLLAEQLPPWNGVGIALPFFAPEQRPLRFTHSSIKCGCVGHQQAPESKPDEAYSAKYVKHGRPTILDREPWRDNDGRKRAQGNGRQVEGRGPGALFRRHPASKHVINRGECNTFAQPHGNAGSNQYGERCHCRKRCQDSEDRPPHHAEAQYNFTAPLLRQPAPKYLRHHVTGKKRGQHQAPLGIRPTKLFRHRYDRN